MSAWNGSAAKAAETKAKVLAYVAVENDAATGSAIKIDKTPVLLDEGSTALDALQQVLDTNGYKDKYKVKTESYGDTIDEIDGMGTVAIDPATYTYVYWSFGVNGEAASVVAGNYKLKNNDRISYVYTSDYTNVECDSFKDDNSKDPNEAQAETLVNTAKYFFSLCIVNFLTGFDRCKLLLDLCINCIIKCLYIGIIFTVICSCKRKYSI